MKEGVSVMNGMHCLGKKKWNIRTAADQSLSPFELPPIIGDLDEEAFDYSFDLYEKWLTSSDCEQK